MSPEVVSGSQRIMHLALLQQGHRTGPGLLSTRIDPLRLIRIQGNLTIIHRLLQWKAMCQPPSMHLHTALHRLPSSRKPDSLCKTVAVCKTAGHPTSVSAPPSPNEHTSLRKCDSLCHPASLPMPIRLCKPANPLNPCSTSNPALLQHPHRPLNRSSLPRRPSLRNCGHPTRIRSPTCVRYHPSLQNPTSLRKRTSRRNPARGRNPASLCKPSSLLKSSCRRKLASLQERPFLGRTCSTQAVLPHRGSRKS